MVYAHNEALTNDRKKKSQLCVIIYLEIDCETCQDQKELCSFVHTQICSMWISGTESWVVDSQVLETVVGRKGFISYDQRVLSYSVISVRSSSVLLQSEEKVDNCNTIYI